MSDPYLWLEDVTDESALDWARERNERTVAALASSERFTTLEKQILDILDTDARIPYPGRRGQYWYNFWRDAEHPRGLWRRTTLDQYRLDKPEWDVLLDLDALATAEDENWVWGGASVLRPGQQHALISLSRGGADAGVDREFDMETRTFVEDGYFVPEAKTSLSWIDADTVYVGTDFGEGSLTDSGYPRIVKRWRRGTPLEAAETVFEGETSDISIGAGYDRTPGYERHFVRRGTDFFNTEKYLLADDGSLTSIDAPTDASVSCYKDWLLIRTNSPWTVEGVVYPAGALLATNFPAFLTGARQFDVLFEPDAHTSLHQYGWTENHLLLVTLSDVQTKLYSMTPTDAGWTTAPLADAPSMATTEVMSVDPLENGDEFLLASSGFTTPASLLYGAVGKPIELLKQSPAFFDASGMVTEQFFATSLDGTQVPYFVVRKEGATGPTVLSGYGGFENSMTPGYGSVSGVAWLDDGGISVTANIRGGGEYGPDWHTQAQKAGRHKVHEDFAAVAQDLVTRGITTPKQLGAVGGSNGGLLMGIMLTKYPELFGALVCRVPLLDMKRYHLLLAGASWVAEYGDPDDAEQWAYIEQYSPYQNTSADASYPPILFTTSARDDRVHPGHARKMVARLEEEGHQQVWYYENIEGGHGGAADNKQAAFQTALAYEFFNEHLRGGVWH
ncbi:prolyl oligopeptidase family serine peptidase [Antrihabitans cavernicola]|uniref:S9 family peptidase n=1 Tax=Antrihabitans cavernicola TaxID=2495913 RepID=A0A5A7SCK9_9NOCA|nr:prolyl oligopeptidase family serine peptidase [Spelaeibacter cavernicola]KAA0022235.1 S9 family peptidase [Spelaeibacter cavernicola]